MKQSRSQPAKRTGKEGKTAERKIQKHLKKAAQMPKKVPKGAKW